MTPGIRPNTRTINRFPPLAAQNQLVQAIHHLKNPAGAAICRGLLVGVGGMWRTCETSVS